MSAVHPRASPRARDCGLRAARGHGERRTGAPGQPLAAGLEPDRDPRAAAADAAAARHRASAAGHARAWTRSRSPAYACASRCACPRGRPRRPAASISAKTPSRSSCSARPTTSRFARRRLRQVRPGIVARLVTLPVPRRFDSISGWASPSPDAPDPAFDRLAGMPAGWRLDGSSRFEGVPARRASSAFDGDPGTSWVAAYDRHQPAWLSVRSPSLSPCAGCGWSAARPSIRFPRAWTSKPEESLPRPARARRRQRPPSRRGADAVRAPRGHRRRCAPRLGARRLLDAVAIREVGIPGLHPPAPGVTAGSGRDAAIWSCAPPSPPPRRGLRAASRRSTAGPASAGRMRPPRLARPARGHRSGHGGGRDDTALPTQPALAGRVRSSARRPRPASSRRRATAATGHGRRAPGARPSGLARPRRGLLAGVAGVVPLADGKERKLGAPEPIDGFANGWRVGRSCAMARFWFAPQRLATVSYGISALAGSPSSCSSCRRCGVAAARRPPREEPALAARARRPPSAPRVGAALAVGVGAGLGAWFFAIRAGILLGVAAAFLAWRGANSRRLLWPAIPLLAVIPLLYVLHPSSNASGFFGYADAHQAAHWLAVGAVCAVAAACLLDAREGGDRPRGESQAMSYSRGAGGMPRARRGKAQLGGLRRPGSVLGGPLAAGPQVRQVGPRGLLPHRRGADRRGDGPRRAVRPPPQPRGSRWTSARASGA